MKDRAATESASPLDLDELQRRISQWQEVNFPDCKEWELVLGVCEEVGELARCILKEHRGIRSEEVSDAHVRDAIGDVVIFLMGVCSFRGWQLSDILRETVEEVVARRWR